MIKDRGLIVVKIIFFPANKTLLVEVYMMYISITVLFYCHQHWPSHVELETNKKASKHPEKLRKKLREEELPLIMENVFWYVYMLKRQSIYRLQFSLGLTVWQNAFMHVRQCIRVCPAWKKSENLASSQFSMFPSYFLYRTLSDHGMNRITTYRSFSPSLWCEFKEMSRFTWAEMVEREKKIF